MKFSIVITCYNQREFIKQAVDSALALDNSESEVVVVDDASDDGSVEFLKSYGDRIRFVSLKTNRGAGEARNCGATIARGDYLVFLDGDDVLLPWAMDIYQKIVRARSPKVILGRMRWFDDVVPSIGTKDVPSEVRFVEYESLLARDRTYRASASAVVIEHQSFREVGGWSGELFPVEDHDLLIKLGRSGRAVQILSPATTLYRWHSRNAVRQLHSVATGLYRMIEKENRGQYLGRRSDGSQRQALIGGLAFFLAKTCLRAGRYRDSMEIVARGWPMILAKVGRRLSATWRGRAPVENIPIQNLQV